MYYFVIFSILSFYYVFLVCGQLLGSTNLYVYSELRSARVDTLTQSPINVGFLSEVSIRVISVSGR